MSYSQALEAAGAKVIEYEEFGSYQGTWMALVELNGERVIIEGSYGSCSGCDAYEAEFGYSSGKPSIEEGKFYKSGRTWDDEDECTEEEYNLSMVAYNKKLAEFGASYLLNPCDKEIIQTRLNNLLQDDWFSDEEAQGLRWALEKLNSDKNAQASVATESDSSTNS
jgi:hypothetical protein